MVFMSQIPSAPSIAAQWIDAALGAIRKELPAPTIITRKLHLLAASMNDAFAAFDSSLKGAYRDLKLNGISSSETSASDQEFAVAHAAHKSLRRLFPDQRKSFRSLLKDQGFDDRDDASGKLGRKAARSVLKERNDDGSNASNNYEDTSAYEYSEKSKDINEWKPLKIPSGKVLDENGIPAVTKDPDSFTLQKPITPHWGRVEPFAIAAGSQFRPPAPPRFGDDSSYIDALGNKTTGDAAFRKQFSEVVDIGSALTPKQKVTAEYWADGPQTSTPPGHWNEIALDLCARDGNSLKEDIKLFHALNAAMFDVGIAVWDAKYTHNFVRPQSAIRELFRDDQITAWAGPNQGSTLIPGSEWRPYQDVTFVTPAFPEYTSGHSGFSYAAATVLEEFFGSDQFFDGVSRGMNDLDGDGQRDLIGQHTTSQMEFEDYDGEPITLQWETLWDAAADAGRSRLYGGIHIQDGDLRGREIGSAVGEVVVQDLL